MSDGVKVWTFRVVAAVAAAGWFWWGYDILTGHDGPGALVAWISLGLLAVVGAWSSDARLGDDDVERTLKESHAVEDVLSLLAALGICAVATLVGLSGFVGGDGLGMRAGRLALAVTGLVGVTAVFSAAGFIPRRPVASRLVAAAAVAVILVSWAASRLSEGLGTGKALLVLLPFLIVVLPLLLGARRLARTPTDEPATSPARTGAQR